MTPLPHIFRIMCLAAFLVDPSLLEAATPAPTSRDLAHRGKALLDAGDLGGALASMSEAREKLGLQPGGDAELADYLALQLFNLGVRFNNGSDAPRAMTSFTEVLKLDGRNGRIRDSAFRRQLGESTLEVAGYLVAAGKGALTLEAYRLLPAVLPRDVRVLTGLGMASLSIGDHAGALEALRQAESLQPDSAEVALGMGRVAHAMAAGAPGPQALELLEKAVDWFRRAGALAPDAVPPLRELASSLILQSQTAGRAGDPVLAAAGALEAESVLKRAVSLDPSSAWIRIDLAALLLRGRRYADAIPVLSEALRLLDRMLTTSPADRNSPVWREARASCLQNRAIASFNLAVDAVNRAEFDQVETHLSGVCDLPGSWKENCRSLRDAATARQSALRDVTAVHEKNLAANRDSAADLLALGDLHAGLGHYDRALSYYTRLDRANRTPEIEARIADVSAPGTLVEQRRLVEAPGGRLEVRFYGASLDADFETALKAAWLRVMTALGGDSLRGPLLVTLYPNRRAFREQAGYRVGGMVKGYYAPGQVSLFMRPGQSTVEWVAVLTHEITHHAVEKLSGGGAPRWLSEGMARWVEGDATVIDRARMRARLAGNMVRTLKTIDESMDRFWNDPVEILDGRDVALLAVEEVAGRRGTDGMKRILAALATPRPDIDAALRSVVGTGLDGIDSAWRASIRAGR